jgi:hypothetical protein
MENKIYNDDVERIVNAPERQATISKKYERKRLIRERAILADAASFGFLSVVFAVLGFSGWLLPFIAFSNFGIFGLFCIFYFGRWYQMKKKAGWI